MVLAALFVPTYHPRAFDPAPAAGSPIGGTRPADAAPIARPGDEPEPTALAAGGEAGSLPEPLLVRAPVEAAPSTSPAAALKGLAPISYVVEPGETLLAIADRFGIDVSTILGANALDDPDDLPAGLQLAVLPVRGVLYRVEDGDTLNRIAGRYGLETREIVLANQLVSSELITPGQALVLPGATPTIARAPARQDAPVSADPPGLAAPSVGAVAAAAQSTRFGSTLLEPAPLTVEPRPAAVEPKPVVVEPKPLAAEPRPAAVTSKPAPAAEPKPAAAIISAAPKAARGGYVWPASGPITTYFGQLGWASPSGHSGLDIAAPWGAPVRAAADGKVVVATRAGGGYGIQIVIEHANNVRTMYAHLSQLNVEVGETVERGELIGLVGSTGFSTGPHLHFELFQNGFRRDPLAYLP